MGKVEELGMRGELSINIRASAWQMRCVVLS